MKVAVAGSLESDVPGSLESDVPGSLESNVPGSLSAWSLGYAYLVILLSRRLWYPGGHSPDTSPRDRGVLLACWEDFAIFPLSWLLRMNC